MLKRMYFVIIICLSFFSFNSKETDTNSLVSYTINEENKVFFVTAKNGLIVRNKPSLKGKRITKLGYGSLVTITNNTGIFFNVKDTGKSIQGEWVKIKHHQYKEAYVFSGFLQKERLEKLITFHVDKVKTAFNRLQTFAANKVYAKTINKELHFTQSAQKELIYTRNNAFLESFQIAYDSHRPLTLSPDVVWLTIAQGFSVHMNENFKELENIVFKGDKPEVISCFVDNLEYDEKQWATLSSLLSKETAKYTKEDIHSLLIPSFSTTTTIESTVYQINLLESFEQAFTYIGDTGCGIPRITLEGETKDWLWIYNNVDKLKKYGLEDWVDGLKPVLKEFVNASKGNINDLFWQDAYKNAFEYMGFYISGWVVKFFPYIVKVGSQTFGGYDNEHYGVKTGKINVKNPFLKGDDYLMSTLSTDQFPSGISQIDIVLKNINSGKHTDMEMHGGFLGIEQDRDLSLKPHIAYVVTKKKAKSPIINLERNYNNSRSVSHKAYEYWCPYPIKDKQLKKKAVYNMRSNKTYEKGIQSIKNYLKDKLPKEVLHKKIRFIVLTNGTVSSIEIIEGGNTIKNDKIETVLMNLPYTWFPALAQVNVMDIIDLEEEEANKLMRVNSYIELVF